MWGKGVYEKSFFFLWEIFVSSSQFAVKLKLLLKKKKSKKKKKEKLDGYMHAWINENKMCG